MTPSEITETLSLIVYVGSFATLVYAVYVAISIYKMNKGIYDAWLIDKEEAKKKISWNLEFNDPKGYLKGLLSKAGKF